MEKSSEFRSLLLIEDMAELAYTVCTSLAVYYLFGSEGEELALLRQATDLDDLTSRPCTTTLSCAGRRTGASSSRRRGVTLYPACSSTLTTSSLATTASPMVRRQRRALRGAGVAGAVRADDLTARYGSEEFVLIMNGGSGEATMVAERTRSGVESWCMPQRDNSLYRQITVSLGVASLTKEMISFDELIVAADQQMYHAKRAGKNRVSVV